MMLKHAMVGVTLASSCKASALQLEHTACTCWVTQGILQPCALCHAAAVTVPAVITEANWIREASNATHPDGADAEVAHVCIQRLSTCSQ